DYVSPSLGTGLFANAVKPAGASNWWSNGDSTQSCRNLEWLGDYRGTIKALVHGHIPFDVLTSPTLSAADLAPYRVVILPHLGAVADGEAAILRQFVQLGGTVVLTGSNPTGSNQLGDARS